LFGTLDRCEPDGDAGAAVEEFPVTVITLTKATLQSTVKLTLKTKSTLESTLQTTIKLLGRRKPKKRRRDTVAARLTVLQSMLANPKIAVKEARAAVPLRETPQPFTPAVAGTQEIRLANSPAEIDAAQALRYRVFYDEMGAVPMPDMIARRRDFDHFDTTCDHLVVLDHKDVNGAEVVGTYRIMRREHARRAGGFYTASEYDIGRLAAFPGTIMELGRSCVDARYRGRATVQLLWRGITEYVNAYGVDLMFGCASLPGTDPDKLAMQLSYLYHYHLAPENLRVTALPERFTEMNLLPREAIDPKRALASLPPLLKGYLRVGGFVGNGAVIDTQFNTTDVCIIVKTDMIASRYTRHYDIDTQREAPPFLRKAS
jgi:putative hemolysin